MSDQPVKRPELLSILGIYGRRLAEYELLYDPDEVDAYMDTLEQRNAKLEAAILKAYKQLRHQGDHDISTDLYNALTKDTPHE